MEQGICPVCNGSLRRPVPARSEQYKGILAGYDKDTDTLPCDNCGGQMMYGKPSGLVNLRINGTPCEHEYAGTKLGNCLHRYTCKHCPSHYTIDSGD